MRTRQRHARCLLVLAVLVTLLVTALHVRLPKGLNSTRLRRGYVAAQIVLGALITLATTGVLVLHEAADVSPTPVHALGGVMGLEGQPVSPSPQTLPEPYRSQALTSLAAGWHLVMQPRVLMDVMSRLAHLLGFGLWLGGLAVATPFALQPYVWNLETLHHVRFGWTYTVLMAIKHGLILGVVGITGLLTWRYRAASYRGDLAKGAMNRWLHAANLALGLTIAWVMIMLLLVHEGIDHAL